MESRTSHQIQTNPNQKKFQTDLKTTRSYLNKSEAVIDSIYESISNFMSDSEGPKMYLQKWTHFSQSLQGNLQDNRISFRD